MFYCDKNPTKIDTRNIIEDTSADGLYHLCKWAINIEN
jgi:hypothetical protein